MIRFRLTSVIVTATLVCMPLAAAAQEEEPMPLTWAGLFNVKPGADLLFEKTFDTYEKPLLDQLVADGKAMSWALGYELAGPGGFDLVIWINAPGWAGIGDIEAMFESRYEGMSEEDLAAMIEDWTAAVEPEGDRTLLLRHKVFKADPEADFTYLRLSHYTAKAGHGDDFMKMYKSFAVPVYDQLLETGVVSGYGMAVQAIHSDTSFTHEAWVTVDSLADFDSIDKAFEDAYAKISDGEGVAREIAFMKMVQHDSHFDRLIRVWKQSE
jgi:hypothetical protein